MKTGCPIIAHHDATMTRYPSNAFILHLVCPKRKTTQTSSPRIPYETGGWIPERFKIILSLSLLAAKKGECQGGNVVTLKTMTSKGPWNNTAWDFLSHQRHFNTVSPSFPDPVKWTGTRSRSSEWYCLVQHKIIVFYAYPNSCRRMRSRSAAPVAWLCSTDIC